MRTSLTAIVSLLACTVIVACGSFRMSAKSRSATDGQSAAAKPAGADSYRRVKDRDNDEDNNDDDQHVLDFGHPAGPSESHVIAALVKRYYKAAATEAGAQACGMLAPFIAETVVEQDGHTPALHGSTCAIVISKLFRLSHRELVGKNTHLKIMRIGIEGNRSLVALEFPEIPVVHKLAMRRIAGKWTLLELLDQNIE